MCLLKGTFFILKEIPEENIQSAALNKCYTNFLHIFHSANTAFTKKVDELCKLWQSFFEFAKEKCVQDLAKYFKLICQLSLRIVLDGDWANVEAGAKTSLSVCLSQVKDIMSEQDEECMQWLNTIHSIYEEPWKLAFLDKIFNQEQVTQAETLTYVRAEQGECLLERIKMLCSSQCDDLALLLVDACAAQVEGELKEFLQQLHLILLYKLSRKDQVTNELKSLDIPRHGALLDHLIHFSKLDKICPKTKSLHLCCVQMLESSVNLLMLKCMNVNVGEEFHHVCRLWIEHVLLAAEQMTEMSTIFQCMADRASSSAHLYILCEKLNAEMMEKENGRSFCVEAFLRALTANINEMESISHNKEQKQESAKCLANGFCKLSRLVVDGCNTISRECLLTSFFLYPNVESFEEIKKEISNLEDECQSDIEISNLFYSEANSIGLSEKLCDDMIILLRVHRHSSFSWSLSAKDLETSCETHMSHYDELFEEKELNYLNEKIDFTQFDNKPRKEVGMYEGIEKGYEQYLLDEDEDDSEQNVREMVKEFRFKTELTKEDAIKSSKEKSLKSKSSHKKVLPDKRKNMKKEKESVRGELKPSPVSLPSHTTFDGSVGIVEAFSYCKTSSGRPPGLVIPSQACMTQFVQAGHCLPGQTGPPLNMNLPLSTRSVRQILNETRPEHEESDASSSCAMKRVIMSGSPSEAATVKKNYLTHQMEELESRSELFEKHLAEGEPAQTEHSSESEEEHEQLVAMLNHRLNHFHF